MKNILILVLGASFIFSSCEQKQDADNASSDEVAKLVAENQALRSQNAEKDSSINSFMQAFNDIDENLDQIHEKENIIRGSKESGDIKNKQEEIISEIEGIYELMLRNKEKLQATTAKLKKSNLRIAEFEKTIARLNQRIDESEKEIERLNASLTELSAAHQELFNEYNKRVQEIHDQTNQMNTAYYAFGTAKELKENGVIAKEGGVAGVGRLNRLKKNFNKDYFTKVDIQENLSFPIIARKAKLITDHPEGSYKFEGDKKVEKITITDPNEFWSVSKYLVIVTEN